MNVLLSTTLDRLCVMMREETSWFYCLNLWPAEVSVFVLLIRSEIISQQTESLLPTSETFDFFCVFCRTNMNQFCTVQNVAMALFFFSLFLTLHELIVEENNHIAVAAIFEICRNRRII